jgi:hypothetical protein
MLIFIPLSGTAVFPVQFFLRRNVLRNTEAPGSHVGLGGYGILKLSEVRRQSSVVRCSSFGTKVAGVSGMSRWTVRPDEESQAGEADLREMPGWKA